jgi:hypothetical protein
MKSFEEYQTISFPSDPNIVYIIGVEEKARFIPIYVGESSRNIGRFGDYISAQFSAPTDFKVGVAVKHLMKKGHKVVIKYKNSSGRRKEEGDVIREIKTAGFRLLNDLQGYDYRTAKKDEETRKIEDFVEGIIEKYLNYGRQPLNDHYTQY